MVKNMPKMTAEDKQPGCIAQVALLFWEVGWIISKR